MDDVEVGAAIPPLRVGPIRKQDVLTVMNVMGDLNPVHSDEDLVRRLGLRGLVNQGPANAAYVVNMLLRWGGGDVTFRRLDYRFQSISCPGDRLVAAGRVTGVRAVDGGREVDCEVWLDHIDGMRILTGRAVLLADAT